MPFLSIIIPVYNVEPYLRECLDSVAASPLDCWEAILIDDGSPDGCPQICDEYAAKDNRFRVIHQENAGVAAARNTGLDAAKGEWIWFVDSDDVVDMRPVAGMVEWIVNHNANLNDNDEVDLVMFDLDSFNEYETLSLRNTALRNADATKTIGWNDNQNESQNENQDQNENEKVAERFVAKRFVAQRFVAKRFVNKNDFLSQHISFFHQQFWYRNENENQNEEKRIQFTKGIRVAEDLERMYKFFTLCRQPVKFQATLYHYRVRETSVTQDEDYRRKAVEDLPVVLMNLAKWNKRNHIEAEPWYNFRIMKLMQNLLYSASSVRDLNTKDFQIKVVDIVKRFGHQQFPFVKSIKIKLAVWNINFYFILNRWYLKIKGYKLG